MSKASGKRIVKRVTATKAAGAKRALYKARKAAPELSEAAEKALRAYVSCVVKVVKAACEQYVERRVPDPLIEMALQCMQAGFERVEKEKADLDLMPALSAAVKAYIAAEQSALSQADGAAGGEE